MGMQNVICRKVSLHEELMEKAKFFSWKAYDAVPEIQDGDGNEVHSVPKTRDIIDGNLETSSFYFVGELEEEGSVYDCEEGAYFDARTRNLMEEAFDDSDNDVRAVGTRLEYFPYVHVFHTQTRTRPENRLQPVLMCAICSKWQPIWELEVCDYLTQSFSVEDFMDYRYRTFLCTICNWEIKTLKEKLLLNRQNIECSISSIQKLTGIGENDKIEWIESWQHEISILDSALQKLE
uniref:Uncharacterized protein n=1 Tax=Pithovirus LCPAC304 TaxID=2506594 RepID=A0A481ZC84_9VIRU|nr:MAG: hypothetical protein LCPAC304_06280 [Pithovirus LCPAC304]